MKIPENASPYPAEAAVLSSRRVARHPPALPPADSTNILGGFTDDLVAAAA
jgi:hypothetical protein